MTGQGPWYASMSRADAEAVIHGALEPSEKWWFKFCAAWRMIGIFATAEHWRKFCAVWSDVGWVMGRRHRAGWRIP